MRGSATILRSVSMRLLPRRSGISSVFSSATRTKPRRIAARRAVEAVRAAGRDGAERRRLDEGAVMRIDVVDLLGDGGAVWLAVNGFEFVERS